MLTVLLAAAVAGLNPSVRASVPPGGDARDRSPFGFHTGSIIPPFEYGFQAPFEAAVDLGVVWERPPVYFFWMLIQPDREQGDYDWARHDRYVRSLPDSMRMMGNIAIGVPHREPRYGDYAIDPGSFMPRDEAAYARFVEAVVERYDGDGAGDMPGLRRGIKYWQVDNEPPHGLSDYAAFLSLTYDAIKRADPAAKVIIGGVSGLNMPHSISRYRENFGYFMPILRELGASRKRSFDVFDFHWYGNATGDYRLVKDIHAYLRRTLEELEIPAPEEYWITEMGTYSGEPKPVSRGRMTIPGWPYQSERQQAGDLVKRCVYPLSFGVKKVFMAFGLKEGFKNDEGYFDFTGLIYDGNSDHDRGRGVKKLGYHAYKKMTEILEGSDWNRVEKIRESGGVFVCRFSKGGKSVWAAWNDGKGVRSVEIPGVTSPRVKVTEIVPRAESGEALQFGSEDFRTEMSAVKNGKAAVLLGESPVLVEELAGR